MPVTIERIFLQARVRYCLVCLHPEDPTLPVRCRSESCPCHGQASGGLCSYDSEVDSYAYWRVANHLKKQGPCEVRVMHTVVLLTPDSGHVILAAIREISLSRGRRGAVEKKAAPRQRQPTTVLTESLTGSRRKCEVAKAYGQCVEEEV